MASTKTWQKHLETSSLAQWPWARLGVDTPTKLIAYSPYTNFTWFRLAVLTIIREWKLCTSAGCAVHVRKRAPRSCVRNVRTVPIGASTGLVDMWFDCTVLDNLPITMHENTASPFTPLAIYKIRVQYLVNLAARAWGYGPTGQIPNLGLVGFQTYVLTFLRLHSVPWWRRDGLGSPARSSTGSTPQCVGFRNEVYGLGFRVKGLGFRV
jgi:hypothetical protein